LAPATDRLPKPLMPVAGRPMLAHILDFLRAGGIDEVVINLHHLGHLIEKAIGDGGRFGLRVWYSGAAQTRARGGGVRQAEPLLGGEPFVVANGDSLLELPLRTLIEFHRARGGIATMAVRPAPDASSWGLIELDADDRVRRVVGIPEGSDRGETLRGFMFPGLHVFDPGIFRWMDPGQTFGLIRETYPRLLRAARALTRSVTGARWAPLGPPDSLTAADQAVTRNPFSF